MDLATELQRIYDSEINIRIGWFWDCGIEVRLAEEMNGFVAAETVASVADILPWLQEARGRPRRNKGAGGKLHTAESPGGTDHHGRRA